MSTYLLHHSVGLGSTAARDQGLADYVAAWDGDPANAWPAWLELIDGFRSAVGQLLGVDATWVSPQANVSSAMTKLLGAAPLDPHRRVIVMAERSFPTLGFVAERMGFDVRFVPLDAPLGDAAAWASQLSDDVAAVAITHAVSNTGEAVDPGPIAAAARSFGALALVDVAQSAGVLPCDVPGWGVDAVFGTSVKWLCGGPGGGFMYASPELTLASRPTDVGWFSHADPFEFDIHHYADAPDARRFWGGTPTVAPFAIARRTIEWLLDVGVEAAREHNCALVSQLIEGVSTGVSERCVVSPDDVSRRSGTAVLDFGAATAAVVVAKLDAAAIAVDVRSTGIRLSPHLITTPADIDRTLDVIVDAVG